MAEMEQGVTIYDRRLGSFVLFVFCVGCVALFGYSGVSLLVGSGGDAAPIFGGGLVLLFCVPLGLGVLASGKHLRNRLPLARLDHAGIECSQGRLAWDDVEKIGIVKYSTGNGIIPYLFFWLRVGAHPAETTARYYHSKSDTNAKTTDWALLLPPWASEKKCLSVVRQFYSGLVAETIQIEGSESTTPPAAAQI